MDLASLSPREREVFDLIASGAHASEIAQRLHLSVKTVSTHREHILEKLNLRGTADIARLHAEEELAMRRDHTLLAAAMVAGVARWERLDNRVGEVCVGALRYFSHLDAYGVPVLHQLVRDVITKQMTPMAGAA